MIIRIDILRKRALSDPFPNATLTLLSLLQGGGNADVQRAEPVAGLGFILLQWCYNPATTPTPDYDCFLSGLLSAIGVQLIGWSRSVVCL